MELEYAVPVSSFAPLSSSLGERWSASDLSPACADQLPGSTNKSVQFSYNDAARRGAQQGEGEHPIMALESKPHFGSLLRRYRRAAHLTQEELAERAGYNPNYISMLERGVRPAAPATVDVLADVLELDATDRMALQSTATETAVPDISALAEQGADVHTFLIADVRGYTQFTLEHGDLAAAKLAAQFAVISREVVSAHDGRVIEIRGDEALALFSSARQALRGAVSLQQRFARETMADTTLPLRVGIGLDAGEAIPVEGGFRGTALNLAPRLCSLAGPGEILASEGVIHLARRTEGLEYLERGAVQLEGFADAVRVVQVEAAEAEPAAARDDRARERPLPIGGFLGALPSGPLVAREEEMHKILASLDAVAGGSGRLVLLLGEPGVGKTRLAQEVTLQLRSRGFMVASGRCYEPQAVLPFYPFLEALATLYAAAPSSIRDAVPQRWPYLGRLLPNENLPGPSGSGAGEEEQERLFWSMTGFLQAVADREPVGLLMDDLHWADASSLALLQHLARHTRAYRVLLLGTYRDVEVGRQHPLERALRDLAREQLAQRIAVRRLDQDGTAAMIATTFGEEQISEEFAGLIHRYAEGNPFFTQEVLQALVERGDIYREDGRWERREIQEIAVPESVRSAIGERLSRLSEDTQELLHQASVLGQVFQFDELEAIGEQDEPALEASLEEATSAGLIRETIAEQYGFSHALIQQALYGELSGRRKRRLHLAAGGAIEQISERRGGSQATRASELTWHFLGGDDPERALPYAVQAGDQAEEVFAHAEAERHYRTALELAREVGDQSREAEVQFKLGTLLILTDELPEAARLLEGARELYGVLGAPIMEARAAIEVVFAYGMRELAEERDRALERAERLAAALEGLEPTHDLALLYQRVSDLLERTGRYHEALALREREVELARALDDDRLLDRAEIDRASTWGFVGRIRDAAQVAEAVIPRAEAAGDLLTARMALWTAAEFFMLAGEFEKSRAYRERELEVAQRIGSRLRIGGALANLAEVTCYQGDWEASLAYAERAFAVRGPLEDTALVPQRMARLNRGRTLLLQGASEEGIRDLQPIVEHSTNVQHRRYGHRYLAEQGLLTGHPKEALQRLEPLVEGADRGDADVTYLLPILAWAYLETGDASRAAQHAVEARDRATSGQNALVLVDALRIHGMVQGHEQQWEQAEQAFGEAVSLARSMPYPYAEACAFYEWGTIHVQQGKPEQARQQLQEALEIFRRLGARPYVERTEQALEKLDQG
jgi:class 3 adenylate cyclase/tetratricopeptide (TPR) repeat protein